MYNFIKKQRYQVTMAIWIFLMVAYIFGNMIMPYNMKYMPFITDIFYVLVILVIYEPFIYYWLKMRNNGLNIMEILGAVLFVIISIIFLGLFFITTYQASKQENGLFYIREENFIHDKVTTYRPQGLILMKQTDIYYIEKYQSTE